MMLRTLEVIAFVAASLLYLSSAEISVFHRDEGTQLRGISKHLKHSNKNISKSIKDAVNDESLRRYAVALQQSESHPAVLKKNSFKEKIIKFWEKSTDLISSADEKNGYISGVLLLQPGQTFLDAYNAAGGVGLVYLSWASLALGFKDNANDIWTIATEEDCYDKAMKARVGLTIRVLGQGVGLLSILGAGPVGGAVFGAIGAGMGYGGNKLMDLLPDDDCDDALTKYDDNEIEVKAYEALPRIWTARGNGIKRSYTYNELKTFDQEKAKEVVTSWSEKFENDYYNGSSYEKRGKNGLPVYKDMQGAFN